MIWLSVNCDFLIASSLSLGSHRLTLHVVRKTVGRSDRLTRSLVDFSKMVEVFERHEVSFVSVTQRFNTTGRRRHRRGLNLTDGGPGSSPIFGIEPASVPATMRRKSHPITAKRAANNLSARRM